MRANMIKVENWLKKAEDQLKRVKTLTKTDSQAKNLDKLNLKLKKEQEEYLKKRDKYDKVANDKNAVSPQKAIGGSMVGSATGGSFADRDSDIPVMKAYDQSDFINKRQENIEKLNK